MTSLNESNIIAEIKKRHGAVIDLDQSPTTVIEIIQNFRHLLDEAAGPDGTAGGPPGSVQAQVGSVAVVNLLMELKRDVQSLTDRVDRMVSAGPS